MLDDNHFHAYANATLQHIHDQLEQAFEEGILDDLDFDEGAGLLNIVASSGETLLLSKHGPSRQVWLASALFGGLHFSYDTHTQDWLLPDGRSLKQLVAENVQQVCGLRVVL